ncbi:alpha/beta hydrolase [Paenibacillus antibioticophila]|uniref:alpha/beta hydrolase n=1 Tax=Paenibacillus antibioticophila TaxID=1274374 RepID=UPI000678032D|nr:hypothetical protein [Paenibacillus antibioticophila]
MKIADWGERPVTASGFADYEKKSRLWVEDTRFVLDSLEAASSPVPAWLAEKIDMNRAGVFGHSFGGATAARMLIEDSRIKAALNMEWHIVRSIHTRERVRSSIYADECRAEHRLRMVRAIAGSGHCVLRQNPGAL